MSYPFGDLDAFFVGGEVELGCEIVSESGDIAGCDFFFLFCLVCVRVEEDEAEPVFIAGGEEFDVRC